MSGDYGYDLELDGALAECRANLFLGEVRALVFEVALHQLLVRLGDGFEQTVSAGLAFVHQCDDS